ncbi:unnamed protein product [Rhizophagus irregularis]|nr:unnamed protein product [Rhizophagus irregularis]
MESKRTSSGTSRFQNEKCSGAPGFRNGKCSSAPGFRNGKMSPSWVSLESENDSSGILDFDRFWESD